MYTTYSAFTSYFIMPRKAPAAPATVPANPSATAPAPAIAAAAYTQLKVLEFQLEDARQQRAKEAEMMTRVIESARIAGEQKVACDVTCDM